MHAFTAVKRVVDKIIEWLCIAILGIMTVLVTYQVITRFIFDSPSRISEVLSQYLFVWMVMYGSAYVFGLREHLDITVLKDKMPPIGLLIVEILANVTLMVFALGVMLYGGGMVTGQQMLTMDAGLQIPMGVIYSSIPICGGFMLFYGVYNIALAFQEYKSHQIGSSHSDSAGTM